jgi:5-methylcytosine-specific restriction endonuclease McrA
MPGKTCSKCGEFYTDATSAFYWRKSQNRFASACKECSRTKARNDYRENKYDSQTRAIARHRANAAENNAKRRARYASDPEVRAQQIARVAEWKAANKVRVQEYKAKYNPEYHRLHREEIRTQQQEYAGRPDVQERRREYMKGWRERNPDRLRRYGLMYRVKNTDRKRQYCREWEERNKERRRLRKRITARVWRADNPESLKLYRKRREARARASEQAGRPTFTSADVRWRLAIQKQRCYWCKKRVGDSYHIDHIIPLSRGGSNSRENICVACAPCNLSKGSKMPEEFAGRLL